MQRPLATLLPPFAALAAFLLPASARCDVPTGAIPADPLVNVQCENPFDAADGLTINTGRLSLGDGGTGDNSTNGLVSDFATPEGTVVNLEYAFLDAWSPGNSKAVDLDYRPYIAAGTLMAAMRNVGLAKADDFHIPEWTVSTRVMMPEYEYSVVLALGANHSGVPEGFRAFGSLVVATGAQADNRGDGDDGDDRTGDELVLWYISDGTYGHDAEGREDVEITNTVHELGRVTVPCLTDSFHLLTVRYADRHVELFLNDRLVVSADLPEGKPEIAPGLQYGQLMGRPNISDEFFDYYYPQHFNQVGGNTVFSDWADDGGVDFLLFYNRTLSNEEIYTLARAYPYIHKDEGNHDDEELVAEYTADVRYVRQVTVNEGDYAELNWVSDGAWVRQYTWDGRWWPALDGSDDHWWEQSPVERNRYDEPAEGAIVAIECVGGGTVTFEVNTEKGGLFPSSDRTYAQLEVNGEGTVKIRPCSGWETVTGDSVTLDPTRASGYQYGTLFFTGSANDDLGLETVDHNATATGIFRTNAEVAASVCDFSNDIVLLHGGPEVTFVADEARVRGLEGPVVKCRLTQEISGSDGNVGTLGTNPSVNADYAQASTLVYVPTYVEGADWLITDKTERNTNPGAVVFAKEGLVAWYLKQSDPLYVDLAEVTPEGESGAETDHFFSERLPWRRGGYDGEVADSEEFQHAAHLNVRLRRGAADTKQDVRLSLPAAKRVRTLTIDQPPASEGKELGLLRLDAKTTETLLTVSGTLKVNGVLRAYNGTETTVGDSETTVGDTTLDTVRLLEGATLTGTGTLAVCNTTFSGLNIDIGTIRSQGKVTLAQDVPETTLAASADATLSTDEPNRQAKALTLNEGSTLDCFAATMEEPAFVVSGKVTATRRVRVTAPKGAQHGLVFLRSGEDTANMDSRAAFRAAHSATDRWDIRVDLTETGADYSFDTPGFAEPLDPTDGTADGENVWDGALEDTLIGLYQDGNYIGGEAEGYTQGTGKVLSASDISEAMFCFRNVAALATHGEETPAARAAGEHSDDYAAVADLIVAYEFGISRVTLERDEDGNEVALVEVTLRNDLATDFADRTEHIVDPEGVTDIEHATPAYAEGTALVFAVNGEIVAADAVTEERGAARAAGTSLTRRFRVSLAGMSADEDGRLALTVRALPPDGAQAASAE